MAEEQHSTTEAPESYTQFFEQLRVADLDPALFSKIVHQIETTRAEATAAAARDFYHYDDERGPITLLQFSEELDNASRRMWGLVAAIDGAFGDDDDSESLGVKQLSMDVARDIGRLTKAFDAERWLALEQEAQS